MKVIPKNTPVIHVIGTMRNITSALGVRCPFYDEAFALLRLNEEFFPGSSGMYVFRGNILLMRGDTTAATAAFREAIRRVSANVEAKDRLQAIGGRP